MLPRRDLHNDVEGLDVPIELLPRYVVVLALSAGMTLMTCTTVFKWDNVKRDAGHGTMFMVFLCWFFWSMTALLRTFVVFETGQVDTLGNASIRRISFLSEVFFNAISMWFMVASYEFQRRALHPRTPRSHHQCLIWYMLMIGGLSLTMLVALVVVDYTGNRLHNQRTGQLEPVSAHLLSKLSWGTWALRWLAIVYPALTAFWLNRRRDRLQVEGLPRALTLIVLSFFALNLPYLMIDTLVELDVLDMDTDMGLKIRGLSKTISYLSGVAISLVMGFSVRGFDKFYLPAPRPSSSCMPFGRRPTAAGGSQHSFFVMSNSSV
ncbi:hypothetical protein H310_01828 [Aphanomyces invadans]|uniref:Intimal thickness related receptor IRP domain-containing protein n=1 Tax=Aphanomyces invadans TaxID=157072 RepID=A0A024ULT4_9STRA|nr:hypothetical protein H310_01828 [Aphanomyces invadans]ETW07264.1 hypothetical protein H310_01828 [Aphanomyces invadans]|eukprot:XP_008863357.1 hypothetical protein H310_01828 [Aphanomyces invadans]